MLRTSQRRSSKLTCVPCNALRECEAKPKQELSAIAKYKALKYTQVKRDKKRQKLKGD